MVWYVDMPGFHDILGIMYTEWRKKCKNCDIIYTPPHLKIENFFSARLLFGPIGSFFYLVRIY